MSVVYNGGFGTVVLVLPWLGTRFRQVETSSLRARLPTAERPLVMFVDGLDQLAEGQRPNGN